MSETESDLEQALYNYWCLFDLPKPVLQYHFHPERRWRFDFCWPDKKIAVEVQGYGPGHTSRKGMRNDADKNNAALQLGWRILYFTSFHLKDENIQNTVKTITSLLGVRYEPTNHVTGTRKYIPSSHRRTRKRNPKSN